MENVKTYKREVALFFLAVWLGLSIWSVYEPAAMAVAEMMRLPVWAFATGAFGLDALSKQFGGR